MTVETHRCGTGTLGRLLAQLLLEDGWTMRVLSRSSREPVEPVEFVTGDLATGEGIEAGVEGNALIVRCPGTSKRDD